MWEYHYTDELYHHGVKGMKWGVRRYQNADGSLTKAGKKRQVRWDASDAKYKEKQTKKTSAYYDKGRRYGTLGLKKTDGINDLKRKLDSDKYDADTKAAMKGRLKTMEMLKKQELTKVSQLTHDQIHAEKVAVGKAMAKDYATALAVTAITLPTTGLMYKQMSDYQAVRSRMRMS